MTVLDGLAGETGGTDKKATVVYKVGVMTPPVFHAKLIKMTSKHEEGYKINH